MINLSDRYQVRSNRESGYGRYDLMLIPREISRTGFVFEFKKVDREDDKIVEKALQSALSQIVEKHYAAELRQGGVTKVMGVAVVVEGKKVWLQHELL
ncbi:MAG: PD-(D/E)XK nuclease domain-containing protein [SAR324 cluster bacterium]|nr:PD-(D/E)XK nuclease domain-containing protein [SAR324 cluster bacterium]